MTDPVQLRMQWLDAIKGVAIVLVLFSHTRGIPYIHGVLVACYMQLFFIASGYVYRDCKGALIKRWKQLLVPYFAWCVIYVGRGVWKNGLTSFSLSKLGSDVFGVAYSRFSWITFPEGAHRPLFPEGAAPMWFLTCMAVSYAVALPLIRTQGRIRIGFLVLYMALSLLLFYSPILLPWSIDTAFLGGIMIFIGYLAKPICLTKPRIYKILSVGAIVYGLLVFINRGINMSVREYGPNGPLSIFLFLFIGVLGTLIYAAFFILLDKTWLCRAMAYLGRLSLIIMCAHQLLICLFNCFCKKYIACFNRLEWPWVFAQLAFVLVGCLVIDKVWLSLKRSFAA